MAESVGIEGRWGYFDEAGQMRDMVQNHLLQILTLIAMEPPANLDADSIRDEKLKVLRSLRPIEGAKVLSCTTRGQYDEGLIDDQYVPGYLEEICICTGQISPRNSIRKALALVTIFSEWVTIFFLQKQPFLSALKILKSGFLHVFCIFFFSIFTKIEPESVQRLGFRQTFFFLEYYKVFGVQKKIVPILGKMFFMRIFAVKVLLLEIGILR